MEITGVIRAIGETTRVSEKFTKREFVLTDNSSQYPQQISFQITQDKCGLLDGKKAGDEVTVHFNIKGRAWDSPTGETKYFNTLEAWRLVWGQSGATQNNDEIYHNEAVSETPPTADQSDDLPF